MIIKNIKKFFKKKVVSLPPSKWDGKKFKDGDYVITPQRVDYIHNILYTTCNKKGTVVDIWGGLYVIDFEIKNLGLERFIEHYSMTGHVGVYPRPITDFLKDNNLFNAWVFYERHLTLVEEYEKGLLKN